MSNQNKIQEVFPRPTVALTLSMAIVGMTVIGCTQAEPPGPPETELESGQVEEIPVTTSSEEARALFDEGQRCLDVARPLKAREKLRAAV